MCNGWSRTSQGTEGCTGLDTCTPRSKVTLTTALFSCSCDCGCYSSNREGQSRGSSPDSSVPSWFRQRFGPSRATRPRSCYTQVLITTEAPFKRVRVRRPASCLDRSFVCAPARWPLGCDSLVMRWKQENCFLAICFRCSPRRVG